MSSYDAADGETGAHMAHLTRYDLIILDVTLPQIDGGQDAILVLMLLPSLFHHFGRKEPRI